MEIRRAVVSASRCCSSGVWLVIDLYMSLCVCVCMCVCMCVCVRACISFTHLSLFNCLPSLSFSPLGLHHQARARHRIRVSRATLDPLAPGAKEILMDMKTTTTPPPTRRAHLVPAALLSKRKDLVPAAFMDAFPKKEELTGIASTINCSDLDTANSDHGSYVWLTSNPPNPIPRLDSLGLFWEHRDCALTRDLVTGWLGFLPSWQADVVSVDVKTRTLTMSKRWRHRSVMGVGVTVHSPNRLLQNLWDEYQACMDVPDESLSQYHHDHASAVHRLIAARQRNER